MGFTAPYTPKTSVIPAFVPVIPIFPSPYYYYCYSL